MAAEHCGCGGAGCGGCAGTTALTPLRVWNRAGLDAVADRVGTHGAFLETMKARIATMTVRAPGADGQTLEDFRPLAALTTRDPSDPAIALLDAWATLGDVLTFYQERITNEGYLRTATERGSLVSLAATLGYAPRPGVSASTYLWYDIDPHQADPVVIPAGSRAQSMPGTAPGDMPQGFETVEDIEARAEWNALPVRQSLPQSVTMAGALAMERVYLAGGALNLKVGDTLLFIFQADGSRTVARSVARAEADFGAGRTTAHLVPLGPLLAQAAPLLLAFAAAAAKLPKPSDVDGRITRLASALANDVLLGRASAPENWGVGLLHDGDGTPSAEMIDLLEQLAKAISALAEGKPAPPVFAGPDEFVAGLLKPAAAQPASAARLGRDLATAFGKGHDNAPQLLLDVVPKLRGDFYTAWSNAAVATADAALLSVHVLRATAQPFGAGAGPLPVYDSRTNQLLPPNQWGEWVIEDSEGQTLLFLDQPNDAVLPGGFVLVLHNATFGAARSVLPVLAASAAARHAYGLSGKTTAITLGGDWLNENQRSMYQLRGTVLKLQSEALALAEAPITDPVAGQSIALAGLHKALKPGRWLAISGERTDIPGVAGVQGRELAMLSGLTHGYDPELPGDATHTTLILATPIGYAYRRDTVVISSNVAAANHGETRAETLGAGDATKPFLSFDLKQSPLTFTPEISAAGVRSSLHVLVDEVEWREAPSLVGLAPGEHAYVTRIAEDGKVSVTFGDGVNGARPPTGVENIRAVYRQGIGAAGNVAEGRISLLLSRPAGVRSVVNPLAASGGADPDAAETIRQNMPIAVAALDRLVSLTDYADFARGFAGIGKAAARRLGDGLREIVHVTIAGVDDIPIATSSELFKALVASLQALGDPALPLMVAPRERVTLVLSGKLKLQPGYQWDDVTAAARSALLERFGFARAALGQPVYLSAVMAAMQGVAGIAYADIDAFGGVPERLAADGARRLLTLAEIGAAVVAIAQGLPLPWESSVLKGGLKGARPSGPAQQVTARPAGLEQGTLRAAQLAYFSPAVPDTIVLNQIQ